MNRLATVKIQTVVADMQRHSYTTQEEKQTTSVADLPVSQARHTNISQRCVKQDVQTRRPINMVTAEPRPGLAA
jgi:hypothetical protein